MKKIGFKLDEQEAIEAAIKEAEGRARERTITYGNVLRALDKVDMRLYYISKSAQEGVEVEVDVNAQHFARSYSYTPMSTHFKAIYKSGEWRITSIYRAPCSKPGVAIRVNLTEKARSALIRSASEIGI